MIKYKIIESEFQQQFLFKGFGMLVVITKKFIIFKIYAYQYIIFRIILKIIRYANRG